MVYCKLGVLIKTEDSLLKTEDSSFLNATTLMSTHGARITMAAGTRFTLAYTSQPDPKADQMSI